MPVIRKQPSKLHSCKENCSPMGSPVKKKDLHIADVATARNEFERHYMSIEEYMDCSTCRQFPFIPETRRPRVVAHIKHSRRPDGFYECPLKGCQYQDGSAHLTTQVENTVSHVHTTLGIEDLKCDHCPAKFSDSSRRSKHMSSAHKDKPRVANRVSPGRRARSFKAPSTTSSQTASDSDADHAPPRRTARKTRARRAAREDEDFAAVPEAVRQSAHFVDDEPVAGPSSGPAFDRLSSHIVFDRLSSHPSSSSTHNATSSSSSAGSSNGFDPSFDLFLPSTSDLQWRAYVPYTYPSNYQYDVSDVAAGGLPFEAGYGVDPVQMEHDVVFLHQPYPISLANVFEPAPEDFLQPPPYTSVYSGVGMEVPVLDPWAAQWGVLDPYPEASHPHDDFTDAAYASVFDNWEDFNGLN